MLSKSIMSIIVWGVCTAFILLGISYSAQYFYNADNNTQKVDAAANHIMIVKDNIPCVVNYILIGDTLWIFLDEENY